MLKSSKAKIKDLERQVEDLEKYIKKIDYRLAAHIELKGRHNKLPGER